MYNYIMGTYVQNIIIKKKTIINKQNYCFSTSVATEMLLLHNLYCVRISNLYCRKDINVSLPISYKYVRNGTANSQAIDTIHTVLRPITEYRKFTYKHQTQS